MRARFPVLLLALLVAVGCGASTPISAPADVAGPPPGSVTTPSGLSYLVLKQGHGPTPRLADKVTVHYSGWTVDGSMFDSSVARGKPGRFLVNDVIPGWTQALQLMKAGSSYRLWIPEDLAYRGEEGFPAGMLVFEVQLISVD